MRGKSFSNRLSWRIIGIVSAITVLAQFAVYFAYKSWQDTPFLHVVMVVVGLASLAAIFFACRAVINYMTRPVTELSKAVLEMAKGDLKAQLPEIKSEDEMRRLHDSFQTMQNSLIDYIEELKTSTAINERNKSDLDLARKIQKGMLVKEFPPFMYAMLHPARIVGGDLYDFTLKGDQLYFAIGDVSGKGIAASLVMAITRVMLRFVVGMGLPLDETLRRINDEFSATNETGMFVTLFVARLDLKTGHMDYSEAEKADLSQYGEERLLEWAKNIVETSPEMSQKNIVENLYDSVKDFTEGNTQNDDITIVSLQLEVNS